MTVGTALSFEGVWKRYNREGARARTLKQTLVRPITQFRRERFWALSDVNLRMRPGETVGLIGANGAGKSTLLRLASGLGKPTRGRIGTVSQPEAILTLGDTFDPLLTGTENAVSAAIIAGLTRKQALRKMDEIVAFAELEEFIDQPLRTYSSGMQLRLAFSVAISVDPRLLVIDEVLSVGDLRFQSKCVDRLREFQEDGATILLSSHDEDQVRRMCNRVVWLARGRIQAVGEPEEVYAAYRASMRAETERRAEALPDAVRGAEQSEGEPHRFGTLEVEISSIRIDPEQLATGGSAGGPPVHIELVLDPHIAVEDPIVGVSLHRLSDSLKVLDVSSLGDGLSLGRLDTRTSVRLSFEHVDLEPGEYYFDVGVYERNWAYVYDYHWQARRLRVAPATGSTFGPARSWSAD